MKTLIGILVTAGLFFVYLGDTQNKRFFLLAVACFFTVVGLVTGYAIGDWQGAERQRAQMAKVDFGTCKHGIDGKKVIIECEICRLALTEKSLTPIDV